MKKLSNQDRKKLAVVRAYLGRFSVAKENAKAVDELNAYVKEDLINPSINGRGFGIYNRNSKSEGSAGPVIHSEDINPFCEQESQKIKRLMDEITSEIGKLEMTKGKTILLKKYLSGHSEREICRDMKISHDTYYKHLRRALLQLYTILIEDGKI